ncbi:15294_t:CDS:2 [Entrophospora sp. SA101]|nr:15294_t:CDS:2 [Entrophospora sp. SA101]
MHYLQPISLIRDNTLICIEENSLFSDPNAEKFSLFQLFNLKAPIDETSLSRSIIPVGLRHLYSFEVNEYNGKTAKVKISFRNQVHTDFHNLLRLAGTNLFYLTENGLNDWVPIDNITFQLFHPNTINPSFCEAGGSNNDINDDDNIDDYNSTLLEASNLPEDTDSDWLNRKLHELALIFQKKNDIPLDVLEGLFHGIFPRKVTSLSMLEGVGIVISAMDNRLRCKIFRRIIQRISGLARNKNLKTLINKNTILLECGFNLVLSIWALVENLKSIKRSCELLKNAHTDFKSVLASEKSHFDAYLKHLDSLIQNILNILVNKQFHLLSTRLISLVTAVENFMKMIELVSVKCEKYLKTSEDEKISTTNRLLLHAGVAAVDLVLFGARFKSSRVIEKAAQVAVFTLNGIALAKAWEAKNHLSNVIENQTKTLKRLNELHAVLKQISFKGSVLDLDEIEEPKDVIGHLGI